MNKLNHYITANLSESFSSIFLPLFVIASVIAMIKLATYTAIVQLTVGEMWKLYLFVLPELLFYILPVTFMVSAVLALYRLSNDTEMVVVFSLGVAPSFIAKVLFKPAFLLSILLFTDYLLVTPYINNLSKNFLDYKKSEAKFNLSASEYGQHFGDWMLYIKKNGLRPQSFEEIVLFNKEKNNEVVITAKRAEILNNGGTLQLRLEDGQSYTYTDEKLKYVFFKIAYINNVMDSRNSAYRGAVDYWTGDDSRDKKNKKIVINTLLSLFPVISVFLAIAFGVVHTRKQNRWIYLKLFISIVAFYIAVTLFQKWLGFHTIWAVGGFWLLLGYGLYRQSVARRF